jgi:hypothetical protein
MLDFIEFALELLSFFPFFLILGVQFLILLEHRSFKLIKILMIAFLNLITLSFAIRNRNLVVNMVRNEGLFNALEEWLHTMH